MAITQAPSGGATLDPASTTNPTATVSYGGGGEFGNLSYADAVQAAYRKQQADEAASGVDATRIDYSQAGLREAGLWSMSQTDVDANAARAQSILNDPLSTDAAKQLAALPGYGTDSFDRSLNDGSNPGLLTQVQGLLSLSGTQSTTQPAASGTDGGTSGTGSNTGTQATGSSSGGTTSASNGGTGIDRLIDLAAMMYGGIGTPGGGSGFGGIVAGPIGTSATGGSTATPASPKTAIVIVTVIVAALGYWYYKKHKKGA